MAILKRAHDETVFHMCDETLVGRSRASDLRLDEPFVSGLHASLHFGDAGWEIRDLGSRNGTRVNGKMLERGSTSTLVTNDQICFGNARQTWVVQSDAPPAPLAISASGLLAVGRGSMLPIPSAEEPEVTVVLDTHHGWMLEPGGSDDARVVEDRETLSVGGQTWTLRVPAGTAVTRGMPRWEVSKATVSLRPPANGEVAVIRVDQGAAASTYEVGSAGVLAKVLIQARQHDAEGWIEREKVLGELGITANHLNVLVFRLRKLFGDMGFANAPSTVQRQRGRMRIGCPNVRLEESA